MSEQIWARVGGWAAVIGGVLGAVAAGFLLVVPPVVAEDLFSFPFDLVGFAAIQIAFFLHHLVMCVALIGFWRAGLAGRTRFASTAAVIATAGMLLLAAQELVAIAAGDQTTASPLVDAINTGYGVITIVLGLGLVLLGAAAARARVLVGASRWVMLIIGCYVYVPLIPAIFAPFMLSRLALGIWLLLFAWLGIAMLRWARATDEPGIASAASTAAAAQRVGGRQ